MFMKQSIIQFHFTNMLVGSEFDSLSPGSEIEVGEQKQAPKEM